MRSCLLSVMVCLQIEDECILRFAEDGHADQHRRHRKDQTVEVGRRGGGYAVDQDGTHEMQNVIEGVALIDRHKPCGDDVFGVEDRGRIQPEHTEYTPKELYVPKEDHDRAERHADAEREEVEADKTERQEQQGGGQGGSGDDQHADQRNEREEQIDARREGSGQGIDVFRHVHFGDQRGVCARRLRGYGMLAQTS